MAGYVTLEAMAPLKVRFKAEGLSYELEAGQRIELPAELAQRLLRCAPGKVRHVEPAPPPLIGRTIRWDSPLFGELEAVVLEVQGGMITVVHPLTHVEASIPSAWIITVKQEQ